MAGIDVDVLRGKVKVIAETSPASKNMREFGKTTKQVENAQKRLIKTQSRASEQVKTLKQSIKNSNVPAQEQKELFTKLNRAYANLEQSASNVAKGNKKGAKAETKFTEKLNEAKRSLKEKQNALKREADLLKEREKRAEEAGKAAVEGADKELKRQKELAKEQSRIEKEEQKRRKEEARAIEQQNKKRQKATNLIGSANRQRANAIKSIKSSNASQEEQARLINRVNRAYQVLDKNQNNVIEGTIRGNKAQRGFSNTISETKKEITQLNKKTDDADNSFGVLGGTAKRITTNFNKLVGRFRVLAFTTGTLGAAITQLAPQLEALAVIAGGVFTDIQFDQARQQLQSFRDSADATVEQLNRFSEIATNAGVRATAVATGMAKFSTAARSAGLNLEQTNAIISGFTQAQSDAGARSDEVNKKLEDLAELAKESSVTMEQLKKQVQFTDDPLGTLATAFGKTRREIKVLVEEGKEFNTAVLGPLADQLKEQSDASDGLAASFNRLLNTVTSLFREFNRAGVIGSITKQLNNLRDFLQTPAGANFLLGLNDAAQQLINKTIPNLVTSIRENWSTIKTVSKTVFGFLIGSAVGGAPGGVIGALIGGLGLGAEAFGFLGSAAAAAAKNLELLAKSFTVLLGALVGAAAKAGAFAGALRTLAGALSAAIKPAKLLRLALGGIVGFAIFEGIAAIARSFNLMSTAAQGAQKETESVLEEVKELNKTAGEARIDQFSRKIEDATSKLEKNRQKLKEVNEFISQRQQGRTNIQPPESLKNVPGSQLDEAAKNRRQELQNQIEKQEKAVELAKEGRKEEKKRLEKFKEQKKALDERNKSLEDFATPGDKAFSDQVQSVNSFSEKITDLRGNVSRLQKEISGGNTRSEGFRDIRKELEGLSRSSLRDAAESIGLISKNLSPQALGRSTDLLGLLVKEIEKLITKKQELKQTEAFDEEKAKLERTLQAYKEGGDAVKRLEIRRKLASQTTAKASDIEKERVTTLLELTKAINKAKESEEENKQATENSTNSLLDEIAMMNRAESAYANGRQALEQFKARKEAASAAGVKFKDISEEEVKAFKKQKDALEDVKKEYERVESAASQTGSTMTSALADVVDQSKELEDTLKDLLKQVAQITIRQGVGEPLADSSQGFLQDIFGSLFNTSSTGSTGGGVAGNVPKGNAKGGIVNRTSAMMTTDGPQTMSEGNKPEAILPLERQNGVMGVKATGGGGGQPIINIINEGGEEPEVSQREDSGGRSVVDIVIPAVNQGIQEGKLDGSLTKRFQGIKPRTRGN